MPTMTAIVCRRPGELVRETRPIPERGDTEVLLRIRHVGICGTDFHIYEGLHPYLEYPRVLGHELSAQIVEAPWGSPLKPGDPVIVNPYLSCGLCVACRKDKPNCCTRIAVLGVHRDGGMCEYLSVPEHNVYPAGTLFLEHAALVEFLAIGAHAVRRATVRGSDRVLVVGAGPIGLGAAIFARIAGADVTMMDRDPKRLALAMQTAGFDRGIVADDEVVGAIATATAGDGFDFAFDATGNRQSMERGFDFVSHGGSYVLISIVKDMITFSDPEFHRREMSLIGSRNATIQDFKHVLTSIDRGLVPVNSLVTHRMTLDEVPVDLPQLASGRAGALKAVINI